MLPDTDRSPTAWRWAVAVGVLCLTGLAYGTQSFIGSRGQALVGIACFLGVAAFFSQNLRAVSRRTIVTGILLQVCLALLILKVPLVYNAFRQVGDGVKQFMEFSAKGAQFVFGPLADPGKPVFPLSNAAEAVGGGLLRSTYDLKAPARPFIFAFTALPTIIFVASFFTVLYHVGILQAVVKAFARLMKYVMGTSGAETLSVTANVFLGQTEAPLIVRPYVPRMTPSELLALMVGGMAHISGGVMAVYIGMGADPVAILTTSIMAAPASLYVAKLLLPETGRPETLGDVNTAREKTHANVIDAAAGGASEGMRLAINIVAMLIAFIAFIYFANHILAWIHPDWSLQALFARVFAPVAFLMGLKGDDVPKMAELLGTKLVLNEFVAYTVLTGQYRPGMELGMTEHGYLLATFALTGFANFASIGIQLGGIGAMAPERRHDLARLGGRALLGGFLATLINASIASVLL